MTEAHRSAAALLARHWQSRTKVASLPADIRPSDLEGGYAIQAELPDALADTVVGWKIAATSRAARRTSAWTLPSRDASFDAAWPRKVRPSP